MKKQSARTTRRATSKAAAHAAPDIDKTDDAIDADAFAREAVPLAAFLDAPKVSITIRLEQLVVDAFKKGGQGSYQKRIRQVLRDVAMGKIPMPR